MNAPIRLYMSMSLDGFIAGPDDRPGQELGRGGGRLFNWLDYRKGHGVDAQIYDESLSTGAVISGRRTFELAGRWNGDHHDGVPIHVLTHDVDPDDHPPAGTTFHTRPDECAAAARASAGDQPVMMHGASAARALLDADELDELEIHLVPVLLGSGRPLFGPGLLGTVELERVRVLEGHDATHLRYRIVHQGTVDPGMAPSRVAD